MATANPYLLFGGKARKGGFQDYQGAFTSLDEALQRTVDLKLGWWQAVVSWDDGLHLVRSSEEEKPRQNEQPA